MDTEVARQHPFSQDACLPHLIEAGRGLAGSTAVPLHGRRRPGSPVAPASRMPSPAGRRPGARPFVFEQAFGRPADVVEALDLDVVNPLHVAEMTGAERALLFARVLEHHPHLADLVPVRVRAVAESVGGTPSKRHLPNVRSSSRECSNSIRISPSSFRCLRTRRGRRERYSRT